MYSLTLVYSLIDNSYFAKISIILIFYAFIPNSFIIIIILRHKSTSNRIIFENSDDFNLISQ